MASKLNFLDSESIEHNKPYPLQPRYNVNTPSPQSSISDIDVANTLVSLKRAAEKVPPQQWPRSPSPPEFGSEQEKELLRHKKLRSSRSDSPIVCHALLSLYDDHSYCITEEMIKPNSSKSSESSIDKEYKFGNNHKSLSDDDDCVYSESDYDEEGWSEEEELYNKEKLKLSQSSGSNSSSMKPNQYKTTTTIFNHPLAPVSRLGHSPGPLPRLGCPPMPVPKLESHPVPVHRVGQPPVTRHQLGRPPETGHKHVILPQTFTINDQKEDVKQTEEAHALLNYNTTTIAPGINKVTTVGPTGHRLGRPPGTGRKQVMLPQTFTIKDEEEDEDVKLAEGANALLNLAGIKTAHIIPLRSISPNNGTAVNNENSG